MNHRLCWLVFCIVCVSALLLSACQSSRDAGDPASSRSGQATSADGVTIRYEIRGEGKLALVFVHGWGNDRSIWRLQLPEFARRYMVVAVDLAGFGESGRERTRYSMEAYGEDVRAVVEALDLEQVILIGHSMSGKVMVEAARHLPDRVVGLIGIDTLNDVETVPSADLLQRQLAPMADDFAGETERFVRNFLFTARSDAALVEEIVARMTGAEPSIALSALREALQHDVTVPLREVRLPIRLINSTTYPTDVAAGKRHAVSFEATFLDDVGHFLFLEKPVEFNQELQEMVRELTPYDPHPNR
ncbi:MAG: alpha/beta hydrolase [bacterium]